MVAVILGSLFLVASVTWLLWSAFSPYAVWQRKDILFQICYGMYGFMDLVCIGKLKIFKQHRLWFKTVTITIFLIGHSNWSLPFFADLFSANTFGKYCFLQCYKYCKERRTKDALLSDSSKCLSKILVVRTGSVSISWKITKNSDVQEVKWIKITKTLLK